MKNEQNAEEIKENVSGEDLENTTVTEESTENVSENSGEKQPEEAKNDELAEMKDKYLRLYSEFDNFRKRTAKERLDLIDSANAKLLTELIPVLDDFERAGKAAEKEEGQLKEGFDLIFAKYRKVLDQAGLKVMEVGPGSEFDADFHEAITQIPAPSEELKGKIVDVVEKGYLLKEKVVRFAKVVVGS